MHRATPANSSFRAFSAGGSRSTVNSVDDNTLMQESGGNMMKNETRQKVESPQNYGFTSVCHKKEEGSPYGAEMNMNFAGGNRSFPTGGAMDDRRHRLRGLSEGDSAMHRGKDDDMQTHFASDGLYHSAPQMVRCQLVPSGSGKANAPQSKAQASQAKIEAYAKQTPYIEARLWAGLEPDLQEQIALELDRERADRLARGLSVEAYAGDSGGSSGGSGGGQQGGGNKPTGQKSVTGAGADSAHFMHIKTKEGRLSHGSKVSLSNGKEDDDVTHQVKGKQDYCGGTPDAGHVFKKVLTVAGPCINVHGRIG